MIHTDWMRLPLSARLLATGMARANRMSDPNAHKCPVCAARCRDRAELVEHEGQHREATHAMESRT